MAHSARPSSQTKSPCHSATPRRIFTNNSTAASTSGSSSQASSSQDQVASPTPPSYNDVPNVNPPPYVDTARVPRYGRHMTDRLLATTVNYESDHDSDTYSDREGLELHRERSIQAPDNRSWVDNGWESLSNLDESLNSNLAYFRQVLEYLRSNWDTPLNSDIEEITRDSTVTCRALTRRITEFFVKWQESSLSMLEARHQMFQSEQHSLCRRAFELISYQRSKIVTKNKIRNSQASRLDKLDEAIFKIQDQHRSIRTRSLGYEQW